MLDFRFLVFGSNLKAHGSKLKAHASKLIAHVALCLIVVAALFMGCGGGGVAGDARLLAIDSIVDTDSVAAWCQLQAIDSASLTTDADRHLYALLHQQILYKQYLPLDTVVLHDVMSFYGSPSSATERNYLVRTMILMGAAHEDAGGIDAALGWYKRAEATADSTDYRNLGQVNLRIGLLYYNNYADKNYEVPKFEKSLYCYRKVGNRRQAMVALMNLGSVYRTTNHPKAHGTLKESMSLAREFGDTMSLVMCMEMLSRCYIYDKLYAEAKELATECIGRYSNYANKDVYYDASMAYAGLGRIDSARYFLERTQPSRDDYQRLMTAKVRSHIYEACGDYANAKAQSDSCDDISLSMRYNDKTRMLTKAEHDIASSETKTMKGELHEANASLSLWKIVVAALVAAVFALMAYYLWRRRRAKLTVSQLRESLQDDKSELLASLRAHEATIATLDASRRRLTDENDRLKRQEAVNGHQLLEMLSYYVTLLRDMMELEGNTSPQHFKNQFHAMTHAFSHNDRFWEVIISYANLTNNGLVDSLRQECSQLSTSDLRIIALMCSGFRYTEIAMLMDYNKNFVSNKRQRIAEKLGIDVPLHEYLAERCREVNA